MKKKVDPVLRMFNLCTMGKLRPECLIVNGVVIYAKKKPRRRKTRRKS